MAYAFNRGPDITYSSNGKFKESNQKTQPDEHSARRAAVRRKIEELKDQRELKRIDEW